jgi:hypothetical protein
MNSQPRLMPHFLQDPVWDPGSVSRSQVGIVPQAVGKQTGKKLPNSGVVSGAVTRNRPSFQAFSVGGARSLIGAVSVSRRARRDEAGEIDAEH